MLENPQIFVHEDPHSFPKGQLHLPPEKTPRKLTIHQVCEADKISAFCRGNGCKESTHLMAQ